MKYQGTDIEINFFDFEHILFYTIIAATVWFVVYTIYYLNFRRYSCKGWGKAMVGNTDPLLTSLAVRNDTCGECHVWKRISHAEYNRSFGIK